MAIDLKPLKSRPQSERENHRGICLGNISEGPAMETDAYSSCHKPLEESIPINIRFLVQIPVCCIGCIQLLEPESFSASHGLGGKYLQPYCMDFAAASAGAIFKTAFSPDCGALLSI
jgi:hypothetical protein